MYVPYQYVIYVQIVYYALFARKYLRRKEDNDMSVEISNVYSSYAGNSTYATKSNNQKQAMESRETDKTSTVNKTSNEEYLKGFQKQVPYIKLQVGLGINTQRDEKVNVVDVSPKLLEKMQNDPESAKKYTQRLKDVEAANKFADNMSRAAGHTVVCSHSYVDENGNVSHFAITVKKDALNEKLREEAKKNAEERIEKSRENARKNAEELAKKLEQKADEVKEDNKKQETKVDAKDSEDNKKDKTEKLFAEKLENAENGEVYLDNEDMQLIIEAAKENVGTQSKSFSDVGLNLDLKI